MFNSNNQETGSSVRSRNNDVVQPIISLCHSATVHLEFIIKLWQW